jgi:hypothetical protein
LSRIKPRDCWPQFDQPIPQTGPSTPPPPPPSPIEWAEQHRRIDGRPFSLDRFAPLRGPYEDEHPYIVIIKPAQRGVSEWAINRALYALVHGAHAWGTGKEGLNVAYLFPTKDALGDFSKERLSGLKAETPELAALFTEYDDVTFKQVGKSYLYLRGAWSETALLSFPADVLILDEYDRMDPQAIALAHRRLNASPVRRRIALSTPTVPGRGIHGLYLQSDRMVYEQPCPGCGAWHVWDFKRDVRADGQPFEVWQYWGAEQLRRATLAVTCPTCKYALSDAERCAAGRWVAQQPEVTGIRGYQIPPLAFPVADLTEMAIAATSDDPGEVQEFYRSDLGQPYVAAGSRITDEMLLQLSHDLPNGRLPEKDWRDTTMGVDVGSRFHYRISSTAAGDERVYVRAMGAVRTWAELDALMATFAVRQCVIDAFPEQHATAEWAAKHRGLVLRASYPNDNALAGTPFLLHEGEGLIKINRTMAMDAVYAAVAGGAELWPAALHNDPEIARHLKAPVRVSTTDKRGQEQVSWVHTDPDHGFHTSVYDRIARAALPAPAIPYRPGTTGHRR